MKGPLLFYTFFNILFKECNGFYLPRQNRYSSLRSPRLSPSSLSMVLDEFLLLKLDSIKRTFDALTERLADPDLASDRKQMLTVSRERASIERTVESYNLWKDLEKERLSCVEMEQSSESDVEMREMLREEVREIERKQKGLEEDITLMLLPKDPNDDRNVMVRRHIAPCTLFLMLWLDIKYKLLFWNCR